MRGEGGHGVLATPVDEILGEPALLLGNRGVALELLGVDDRQVEARAHAVVEEDGVQHLAPGGRQTEGDVADAEDRLRPWQRFLDEPDALDRLRPRADVVLVAGAHREDQRIEDDVLLRHAVLLGEEPMAPLGDGELPRARDRHAPRLVLVDAADDDGGPVAVDERDDLLEPLLAVLQVDRVDDRLPLAALEGLLEHGGVGRVEHERDLHLARQDLEEGRHVGELVAIGVGEADVEHLRAAPHLPTAELGRLVEIAGDHQLLEATAADHVGAFADDDRPPVVLDRQHLDPRDDGTPGRAGAAGWVAAGELGDQAHVLGGRAAAAAHEVHPSLGAEALELPDQALGRLVVAPLLVRQPGVREAGHREARDLRQRAQVVGHEVRAGGAVEADGEKIALGDRDVHRLDRLSGEHRAHGLDRHRQHDRDDAPGGRTALRDAEERRLDVQGVLLRLEEEDVDAALEETARLLGVGSAHLIEGHPPGDGDGLRARPHRARDEARVVGRLEARARLACEAGRRGVDLPDPALETVLGEDDTRSPECIRLDDVRARREVARVHVAHHVGAGEDQMLVAAFVLLPAEVGGPEIATLEIGPRGAVEDDDALGEEGAQTSRACSGAHIRHDSGTGRRCKDRPGRRRRRRRPRSCAVTRPGRSRR